MKVLILGSTGRTGQELVKQAIDQGHEVTAFVRDPTKMNLSHEKLTIAEGNILDKAQLLRAIEGKDAVLSALGSGKSLKSNDLVTNAVNLLLPAMEKTNIQRLIFLSAFGVGETYLHANMIQRIIFKTFLKNIYADKGRAEVLIRASNLDWTFVYPVVLTDGPLTGKYQVGENLQMKGMPKISRADVAEFMLQQLTGTATIRKAPIIMS